MAGKTLPPGVVEAAAVVHEPLIPPAPEASVTVITTAKGTLGPGGIVPIGTECEVAISAFSKAWMKPKTKADADKIAAAHAAKTEGQKV